MNDVLLTVFLSLSIAVYIYFMVEFEHEDRTMLVRLLDRANERSIVHFVLMLIAIVLPFYSMLVSIFYIWGL